MVNQLGLDADQKFGRDALNLGSYAFDASNRDRSALPTISHDLQVKLDHGYHWQRYSLVSDQSFQRSGNRIYEWFRHRYLRLFFIVCAAITLIVFNPSAWLRNSRQATPHPSFEDKIDRNPAFLIKASHGAVATENHDCSLIGVEILKEGGNAVDSAIASTFCIGVVNLFS